MTLVVGIDPGVNTGFAIWDKKEQGLMDVACLSVIEAFDRLDAMLNGGAQIEVRFEDARLRTWFANKGREALQGAGSIKRDCLLWETWLQSRGVPYKAIKPAAGATKWDAAKFQRITGWTKRTNEHARDAALLCFGVK